MKLYINIPTTKDDKKIFNQAFSRLQVASLLKYISDLGLSNKKKVLLNIINELEKERGKN